MAITLRTLQEERAALVAAIAAAEPAKAKLREVERMIAIYGGEEEERPTCPTCGKTSANDRALYQHRLKYHGWRSKPAKKVSKRAVTKRS